MARDITQMQALVAVKVAKDGGTLENEAQILRALTGTNAPQGFTELIGYSSEATQSFLVIDLLGESLEQLFRKCDMQFQLRTVVSIAKQVLLRIEYVHSKGIVHRDIKPDNFVMGLEAKIHHVHLIDFGLSKPYFNGQHIGRTSGMEPAGTPRYVSINTLKGIVQSRRDDLEAIGYMLLHFLRGCLPWSRVHVKRNDPLKSSKLKKILEMKESTKPSQLCLGFPNEFKTYMEHCRGLGFQSTPGYTMLRKLFEDVSNRDGPFKDHDFEWLDSIDVPVLQLEPLLSQSSNVCQPDVQVGSASSRCKYWLPRLL